MEIPIYCAIAYLIVPFVLDVCEATCEEYTIIFEENTCPIYRIKPLTHQELINWVGTNSDCNSTEIYYDNKECLLEFEYMGTMLSCIDHIKPTNNQSHVVIPDEHRTPKVIKRNLSSGTVYVNNNKTEERNTTLNEKDETPMFNVHLLYTNNKLDVSNTNNKKLKMHDNILCRYAEIVCNNKESSEYIANTDSYFHDNSTVFIDISIDRDETSPLQPIFTGYFPDLTKEALSSYENDFKYLKTASLKCPILKNDTSKCDTNKSVNVYINTNYIQNDTKTNYPNCAMVTEMIHNTFHLICDNVTFAKYNKHLKFTSKPDVNLTPTPKSNGKDEKRDLRSWSCQITEFKDFLTTKRSDNDHGEINFKNCFKDLSNTNSTSDHDKNDVKSAITDLFSKKLIKIVINENDNCTKNPTLNLQQGKLIDFGVNKHNVFKNDEIEINLSNCFKITNITLNNTDKLPHKNLEMIISLKNESLNVSDLKLLNGALKETDETERLFLQCDHSNNSNNETIKNITVLQCETIGAKDLIIPENNIELNPNTTQDHRSWNCQIPEFKDSLITKRRNNHINEIYFNDCLKDLRLSSNNTDGNKEKKELISSKPDLSAKVINADINATDINAKKLIKIIVNENSNCTKNPSLNLQHGKIIDFEVKNVKRKVLKNDVVELNLSNCIKANYSIINGTDKLTDEIDNVVEMTIFLKNESLNAADLKLLNGPAKKINEIERLILRCDRSNNSNNNTSTKLQCEAIDSKDLIMLENNTDLNQDITQDDQGWNCQLIEFKDFLPTKGKIKETYFKNCFKGNNEEKNGLTSSKPILKKDNKTDINPKKLIKIIVKEYVNCTQNTALNIQHGKFVDFEVTNDKSNILENSIVEINLSDCINASHSTINSTDKLPQIEMTIFLKNDSLNASDLKLLNQTLKQKETDGSEKLFLRCNRPNAPNSKTTNNSKAFECETIELKDLLSTDVNQNTTEDTATDNNNKNKNEKNNAEGNTTFTKDIGEKNKMVIQNHITFNRKKDVDKLGKQENLVVEDVEVEKIILITLSAIAGTSTVLVLALRFFKKSGHRYNPAATREPGADEETAF